jgi:hypothetical protein
MVHGVGRHDRLSALLEIYQAIRSDLRSPEAPAAVEDRIPDWKLERFEEGATPPYLKLRFTFDPEPGDAAVAYIYEVNYSALAGVIRANHRLDLTTLFVGFDVAVCWARQQPLPAQVALFPGRPERLARALQRVSGVMTAATGPLLGIPALLYSRYSNSFVAAFTRFFEDVVTYALDKSGEQLISEHLDRTVERIRSAPLFQDVPVNTHSEFVMAAHSLGSVVTHSFVVRHWTDDRLPKTVVTFGSPIGLITWLWLFLDFEDFDFTRPRPSDTFFCWKPLRNDAAPLAPFRWFNVVNCLDPIATSFPVGAADLSRTAAELAGDLPDGIQQHHCGTARVWETGRAHTEYLHDRDGFLEILQRAAGLRPGRPQEVRCNPPEVHWRSTFTTLGRVQAGAWLVAMLFAVVYCGFVAWHFQDPYLLLTSVLFTLPVATVGGLAFVQRFFFGGRTKRISAKRLRALRWDPVGLPYRLRQWLGDVRQRLMRREIDDTTIPQHRPWMLRLMKVVAFLPTLAAMLVPAAIGWALHGDSQVRWMPVTAYFAALAVFVLYLLACAVFELVSAWRSVLASLNLSAAPGRPPDPVNNPPHPGA